MNQPNSPIAAVRSQTSPETPDVFSVVRRYVWLLIGGAVFGAVASGGLYAYCWKYYPCYTARVKFEITDPPERIGTVDNPTVNVNSDDTSRLIHRQEGVFDMDAFLQQVISDPDFQRDPSNPGQKNQWIQANGADLRKLRKWLKVEPQVASGTFDLTMTAHDPNEAYSMVMAAKKVYLDWLANQSKVDKTDQQKRLDEALTEEEGIYQRKAEGLQLYADTNGIDVEKSKFEIEKTELQNLNELGSQAAAEAQAAAALYQTLIDQDKQAHAAADANPDQKMEWFDRMKLTPDMEQYMENDMTLRQLQDTRLVLFQERAGQIAKGASSTPQGTKEIDGRIAEVDKQIDTTKKQLRSENVQRMEERAKNDMQGKQELADQYKTMREAKEDVVTKLGQSLMQYQEKDDDVKEERATLEKIRDQDRQEEENQHANETRVQPMGEQVAVPSEVSWPKWYWFLFPGSAAGLGLSALLAYLLVLTDTRVRTPRDISRTLQLPVLGFVPDEQDDRTLTGEVETAILTSPMSMLAESFRQMRSHITAQTAHAPINTLLVASITPGGGATTVAANLAAAMALNEMRVLLVDANFYRPRLAQIFKGMPSEGLIEAVGDTGASPCAIVPHPSLARLHLLNCGHSMAGASSEKFTSKPFRELIDQLKGQYDLIIFDGAPLNLVSDSLTLASQVDGVVSVVRAGEVSRGAVSRVREQLRGVHANLLGFVLNAVQTSNTGYFKEHYRSFYRYAVKNGARSAAGQ